MISVSGVSMRFGSKILFDDVTTTFSAGRRYGLTGPNGAGKSTFMKLLTGESQPQRGTVVRPDKLGVLRQDQYAFDQYRVIDTVVMGNQRLRVFPVWEMSFAKMPGDRWHIATERVKWNVEYQKRYGIDTAQAELPEEDARRIQHVAKRAYRALELSGYARIDFRMNAEGKAYVIEANPNPQLAYGEDFAESAERAGISYENLIQRIINLGLRWRPERPTG